MINVNMQNIDSVSIRRRDVKIQVFWQHVVTIYTEDGSTCWLYLTTEELSLLHGSIDAHLTALAGEDTP